MTDRRHALAALGLGWLAPTRRANATASQVPAFSTAPAGATGINGWQHQRLPKVERANEFTIVSDEGQSVLQVRSSSSASSWLTRLDIDATGQPMLRWRWKVSHSLERSDLRIKQGDDYAARLYVTFELPLAQLSLADRLRIQTARLLTGNDVPAAALCYVWGHAQPAGSSGWNPYTDRVRMIVLDSGNTHAQQWRTQDRDIAQDWATAFGGPMPRISGLAVSADTDNTGDSVEAWFGDIKFAAAR